MYSFFDVSTLTSRVLFTIFITVLDFSVNMIQLEIKPPACQPASLTPGSSRQSRPQIETKGERRRNPRVNLPRVSFASPNFISPEYSPFFLLILVLVETKSIRSVSLHSDCPSRLSLRKNRPQTDTLCFLSFPY